MKENLCFSKLRSVVCELINFDGWKYFQGSLISVIILVWELLDPLPLSYFGTFSFVLSDLSLSGLPAAVLFSSSALLFPLFLVFLPPSPYYS